MSELPDLSKIFKIGPIDPIEQEFFVRDMFSESYKNFLALSRFSSNSDDTLYEEKNKNRIIFVQPKSSNSQKQSENPLKSSSNLNKSKENKKLERESNNNINNVIIETNNNNEEDAININKNKQNKMYTNHIQKGKNNIKFENENDKTNDQTNSNFNNDGKVKFYTLQKRSHDKDFTDNKIKKTNAFLINDVIVVFPNKIIKNHQKSKPSPESNSLKMKKDNINDDELVKISGKITNDTSVEFNKNLRHKTVKEILSFPISEKNKKYNKDHNKQIIEKYYNECISFKLFCDLKYEDIINLINNEDNSFEGFLDTYKEELEKRKDKEDIKNNIKNFLELIKSRKKRKMSA